MAVNRNGGGGVEGRWIKVQKSGTVGGVDGVPLAGYDWRACRIGRMFFAWGPGVAVNRISPVLSTAPGHPFFVLHGSPGPLPVFVKVHQVRRPGSLFFRGRSAEKPPG